MRVKISHLLAAVSVGLCAQFATAGSDTEPTEHEKYVKLLLEKDPDSSAARREMANWWYSQTRAPAPVHGPRVIYGADDRMEVYEYDLLDPQLRQMAEAAAVVVNLSDISDNGDGTYTLLHNPWTSAGGGTLCADEPFRGQPQMGFCSSFLVGPDLMVTAGHCVSSAGSTAYVFGFQLNDADETGPVVVPADWIYFTDSIVTTTLAGDDDYTVVRLDREVVGINPVPIRHTGVVPEGTPLAVIGHPAVILKKIAGSALTIVQSNAPAEYFTSNLDTYGGNSGSMVINLDTYTVEGILVRGLTDYVSQGGCIVSNRLPDNNGSYEEVSKTIRFESFVPELGLAVSPAGLTQHVGLVGGPFTNDTPIDYTLSNPTGDPIDYSVVISGDGFMDLSGDPLVGTIAGGSTATITAALNTATATGLPRGLYDDTITFTDVTNGRDVLATHQLEIGQTVVSVDGNTMSGGGPVGGPFPLTGDFTITSERPTPVDVRVSADVDWIDVDGVAADTNPQYALSGVGDAVVVHATINSAANSLPAGLATGNLVFTNLDNGEFTSFQVLLDVGRFVFTSTDTPINITDNTTITSTITVPSGVCVGDVDIDLDATHTFSGDLHITLTSAAGTSVKLHNETGSSDDFTPRFYDDDDPANTLPDGPGVLADFELQLAGGDWVLTVEDDAGGDTGTLNSWQLRIATLGDVCPPEGIDSDLAVDENWLAPVTLTGDGGTPPYQFQITTLPAKGVLWDGINGPALSVPFPLSGDTLVYRADIGAIGADNFGFAVSDGGPFSPEATISVIIGQSGPIHFFGFDTDPGWTTEGDWAFGIPQGLGGSGFASGPDPTSGFTGDNVYGYNLAGDYANNIPEYALTTPALAVSGAGDLELSFMRWLGMESSSFDHAKIEVAADGGAWQTVWEHTSGSFGDDAWVEQTYDLDPLVADASELQFRWIMGTTDSSVQYPGWNLDDVAVSGTITGTRHPVDFNGDGLVNLADVQIFITAFPAGDPGADLNGDGLINLDDVLAFIDAFING